MKTRSKVALATTAIVALLLTACSTPGGAGQGAEPETTAGGVAVVSLAGEPGTLDPSTANTFTARIIFTSVCEKLYDADDNLELVPQLAAELPEVSEDGLTVDIALREGVTFNDGTPFDATAVKISLDRHRTLPTSARKLELAAISDVAVVDDSTVRLTLSRPFSPLGAQLADRAGAIMSPTALEELGDDFGSSPVCVGPFAFEDQVSGSEMNFVKSDFYYDKDKVKLDGVTYQFVTDANIRVANLRSGDINVAERVNASDLPQLKTEAGIEILESATIAYQSVSINVDPATSSNPLATSVDLRRAFELSLDREAVNDVVFNGTNVVDCIPLPGQSAFRPDDVTCSEFDPEAARKILEDSGETLPLAVELMYPSSPTAQKTVEVIQQMANDVGFDVTLKPVEFISALEAGRAGDFEMFLIGWSGRIDPDGDVNDLVTSGGSNNFSRVSDPQLDSLVAEAASVTDTDARKDLYEQVLTRIDELKPNIYLYHDSWFLGLSGITGVEYSSDAIPRFKTASLTE
ncbi:ABC transporter substrate-binding protein [Glaciibacter superstes]|uniref:ABC transporter substrate-binding protein n=1 Tax=Glaciibacter superstes TaxID=501023 RepID=UPI0003B5DD2F|nr:ABC transporter substrate-binding protein [Glaciibacter superstes]